MHTHKNNRRSKTILNYKKTAEGITIMEIKHYEKYIVISTAWCYHKTRHADQQNAIEDPGIIPHT